MVVQTTVDLDEPLNWPDQVKTLVSQAVRQSDLREREAPLIGMPLAVRQEVEGVLAGFRLRLYHAARLTDPEVQGIRANGLLPASADLVRQRLQTALECGAISATDAAVLESAHLGDDEWRTGRIFLVTSRRALLHESFAALTVHWGGEMLHWAAPDELRRTLQDVGHPYLVAVAVPVRDVSFPGLDLPQALIAASLQWSDCAAEVVVRRPIPAQDVISMDKYSRRLAPPNAPDAEDGLGS